MSVPEDVALPPLGEAAVVERVYERVKSSRRHGGRLQRRIVAAVRGIGRVKRTETEVTF